MCDYSLAGFRTRFYVDTTGLTIDEVEATLLKIIRDRTSNGKERTH